LSIGIVRLFGGCGAAFVDEFLESGAVLPVSGVLEVRGFARAE
jgi:hypothetical protein